MEVKQYPLIDLLTLSNHHIITEEKKNDELINQLPISTIDIESIKNESFLRGKEDAMTELQINNEAHNQKTAELFSSINKKLASILDFMQQNTNESINDIIALSMTIAKKIIGTSISNFSPELIKDFLESQLRNIPHDNAISIKVSNQDFESTKNYIESTTKNDRLSIIVIEDKSIHCGDCSIEIAGGKINIDRDALMLRLEHIINNAMNK